MASSSFQHVEDDLNRHRPEILDQINIREEHTNAAQVKQVPSSIGLKPANFG